MRLLALSALLAIAALSATQGVAAVPTRAALFEGSGYPERREFPLSTTAAPCKDFYAHVCSGVNQSFQLREDRSLHIFSFSDSHERLFHAKKRYLGMLAAMEKPSPRVQALRDVYAACMNPDAAKREERELVQAEIARIEAATTLADLRKLLSARIGTPDFTAVQFAKVPNQDDPKLNDAVLISEVATYPERTYYEKPDALKALERIATQQFRALGLSKPEERARSVVALEKELTAKDPLPAESRLRMAERNYTTRDQLVKSYPSLDLGVFLKRVPTKTRLRNLFPETLAAANDLLTNGDLATIKNLLIFHATQDWMDDAYSEFRAQFVTFQHEQLGGPKVRPSRDERCTNLLMSKFDRELDAELMPILFPDFPREQIIKMVERVRASLIQGLQANTWLTPVAKKEAIRKMRTARLLLVSPRDDGEWHFNPPATYDPTRPYANLRLLDQNLLDREIGELGKPRNRSRWLIGPLTINAYYTPPDNVFVLPIGILQYPFFDAKAPLENSIAAIGSVIGHELGHGIDDQGSQYDDTGKRRTWMTAQDRTRFHERSNRFIARFDAQGADGRLTLGENIGDHVGITTSHRAVFQGKPSTPEAQRDFFIHYARSWCGVVRPSLRELLLKTDPHSPIELRVNEQVRHLKEFHESFSCKAGDPMFLPEAERIRIW